MILGNPIDQIQAIRRPEVLSHELQHHNWVPGTTSPRAQPGSRRERLAGRTSEGSPSRPRQWRLEQNPIFSEAVSYRGIVEGEFDDGGNFVIERVVERSPIRTVRTMVPRMLYQSDNGKAFLDRIMELGGMWYSFALGIFVFSYPEDARDGEQELFNAAVRLWA